jgi:probable F420-dependent oxidoreductase
VPDPRKRPFRFGAVTTGGTEHSRRHWSDYARRLESLGFGTLFVADHYLNSTVCTPRLAAAAAATTTLRLGSYVYDNDFRHPVLLAREAAEIDLLSSGRMELGIGAGWAKDEYDTVGVPFDPGPVRASRYEEAVLLIRALHAGSAVTHHGQFYDLRDCELLVEPVQRPIPLLLGGGGPRMTRFAATHGDIIGFVPQSLPAGGLDPGAFAVSTFGQRIRLLDEMSAARADGGPERAVLVFHQADSADDLPTGAGAWTDPDTLPGSPYALLGDKAQVIDSLLERRERWGLTYIACWEEDVDRFAPVVAALSTERAP